MKKNIIFTLLVSLALHANSVTDKEKIDQLIQEVKVLQNELVILKNRQEENRDEIEEIVDYTENIEAITFKDKLNFGLGFKTNLDNFDKKYADGHSVRNSNVWSNKLMLNMKADIAKNMNFYGRLSMYKYWGSNYIHPYTYYDNMQGRVPSDSAIYVERAYINWFFNQNSYIPMALTIGRQPSSDGPSNHFKDNSARKGTYSALLYDGAADGLVYTANISKIIENPKSFLRVGYAKGFGYSETSVNVGNAFIGASNNDIKDTNVFGLFLDTTIPRLEYSFVQLSYSKMIDIVANPLDTNTTENKNIGDVDLYGAMIQLTNIEDTHLDLFAQYGHSVTHPNNNSYADYGTLLGEAGDKSSKSGDAYWLGGRYGFGNKQIYKLGCEYNYGSKNWINLTQGSFDIYNKLSTRGSAYEGYIMYLINRFANIRLGYIYIDYNYTGSGWFVGSSKEITNSMENSDESLSSLQSIYLKMSITF